MLFYYTSSWRHETVLIFFQLTRNFNIHRFFLQLLFAGLLLDLNPDFFFNSISAFLTSCYFIIEKAAMLTIEFLHRSHILKNPFSISLLFMEKKVLAIFQAYYSGKVNQSCHIRVC